MERAPKTPPKKKKPSKKRPAPADPSQKKPSKKRPAPADPSPKRAVVPFLSHCVSESFATRLASPSQLTVKELKVELAKRGAATSGLKGVLVARLVALQAASPAIRSAEDAEKDRAKAGESRAVEHVADIHPTQARQARRKAAAVAK